MEDDTALRCHRRADACIARSEGLIESETKAGWIELAMAWLRLAESVTKAEAVDLQLADSVEAGERPATARQSRLGA